jgi:DNA-binding helix-hairpin-helix protein with protein kinase domain
MSAPQLFLDGKPLKLGDRIGRGGEGEVFVLADDPSRAVKFYTVANLDQREQKVDSMVRMGLAQKSQLVAFPQGVARDQSGRFRGFVMQLVRDHKPLFELYSPGARKQNFPSADYRFLVRAALNTAKAVASVHATGCVIGDINHSGILVSKNATAALIDADSFQVSDGVRQFLCAVGVPEYTPPELQGKSLSGTVRTQNHDAFGLAVAIFQLLAMGRHPFIGSFSKGEMPMEKAITELRFAYSRLRNVGMTPPPGAITLQDFPTDVASAFERAFGSPDQASRPSALEWVSLLEGLERSLKQCSSNKLHHYSASAASCPWCRMEQRLHVVLFVPTFADFVAPTGLPGGGGDFNLAQIWARIEALQIPTRASIQPAFAPLSLQPSSEAVGAGQADIPWNKILLIGGGIALTLLFPAVFIIGLAMIYFGWNASDDNAGKKGRFIQKFTAASAQLNDALDSWETRCGLDRIEALKAELVEFKRDLETIPAQQSAAVTRYQNDRRALQLQDYLERFRIRDQKIHGIGPSKLATLASYGIETAADVTEEQVRSVPGFGPVNSLPLIEWANSRARGFVYNPQQTPKDQMELARISSDLQSKARSLQSKITSHSQSLFSAVQACQQMSRMPDAQLALRHRELEQARKDLEFLKIPVPAPLVRQPRRVIQPKAPPPSASPSTVTLGAGTSSGGYTVNTSSPSWVGSSGGPSKPACPKCGGGMQKRVARRGRNAGGAFWGCMRYPRCDGTRNI